MSRLAILDRPQRGTKCVSPPSLSRWTELLLFLLFPVSAVAQISPGELSKAHSSLEGPLQCLQCHVFGAGRPEFKCLSCHTEIRERIAARKGYHARLAELSKSQSGCARCHAEHNGKDFNLIRWPASHSKFDHREAGFVLEGRHTTLDCQQCHRPQNLVPQDAVSAPKNASRTFLALSPRCTSCHRDVHRGTLGSECSRCHSSTLWKPARLFRHDSTRFSLTGLHENIACSKCHRPSGDSPVLAHFKVQAFSDCAACHADPHKGAFASACGSCHNTAGWRQTRLTSGFDHRSTGFPLRGKHETLPCSKCHKTSNFKEAIRHGQCLDCHSDPHRGQFRKRADQGDCSSCHSETGFKPATFTEADHTQTAYPLAGKHAGVTCEKCHLPMGRETNYHPRHAACMDCHKDAHAGEFAGQPHQNRCEACHSVEGFRPSIFTIADHKRTRFVLIGAHLAVACEDCHKHLVASAPLPMSKFHFPSLACGSCHADPHRGQFSQAGGFYQNVVAKQACETCHSARSWKQTAGFDHDDTGFSLAGAHRSVACIGCHRDSNNSSSRLLAFDTTPRTCSGCHKDPHGGQFGRAEAETDCAKCHSAARWRPSTFDHEDEATFSLAGAHQRVPCRECHQVHETINGENVLVYASITKQCSVCHK